MDKKCQTCKYYRQDTATSGHCCRYPPTSYHEGDMDKRPQTRPDEWCGEYRKQ